MKKIVLAMVLATGSLAATSSVQAQMLFIGPSYLVGGIGVTGGGGKLATASYTDGSSADIRAGSGLALQLGGEYRFNPEFSVQATAGYHIHFTPEANNGDASFSRVPLELLGYFHTDPQWRVGGGLRRTVAVRLNGKGAASNLDRDFKNATGAVFEVEYLVNRNLGIKGRVVTEKFKPEGGGREVNGNHVGLFVTAYL